MRLLECFLTIQQKKKKTKTKINPRRYCITTVSGKMYLLTKKHDVGRLHKVRTYKEYHSVCPLVGIGTLPTPLSPASVPLLPEPRGGGGHTRLRGRGWGSPNSDDYRKSLALCFSVVDQNMLQLYIMQSIEGMNECTKRSLGTLVQVPVIPAILGTLPNHLYTWPTSSILLNINMLIYTLQPCTSQYSHRE